MPKTVGLIRGLGYRVGFPDQIDIAAPGSGLNASLLIRGSNAVKVLAATCQVDTDSNAANRFVSLDYITAKGTTYVRNGAGLVLTASTVAQKFWWSCQRSQSEWAANTPVFVPLLDSYLYPGDTVQFTLDNIQATDALTNVHLLVERFETGTMGYELGAISDDVYEEQLGLM